MKNRGKKTILSLLIMVMCNSFLFAEKVETVLEKDHLREGEITNLTFKISGSSDDVKPVKEPKVKGLVIDYSGLTRSFSYVNGKTWRGIEIKYSITAVKKGKYRIPSFIFEIEGSIYHTEPVVLLVTRGVPPSKRKRRNKAFSSDRSDRPSEILPHIEFSKEKAYVGEPLVMRYFVLSAGVRDATVESLRTIPKTEGFVIRTMKEVIDESVEVYGGNEYVKSHLFSFLIIPARGGQREVGGGKVFLSVNFLDTDPFFSGFGFTRRKQLTFGKENITIMNLPEAGKPRDYKGDVGAFTIETLPYRSDCLIYEETRIEVKVEGKGNLLTLSTPYFVKSDVLQGIKIRADEKSSSFELIDGELAGSKVFTFTLIPEVNGKITPGRIVLPVFNPEKRKYELLQTKQVKLNVSGKRKRNQRGIEAREEKEEIDLNWTYFLTVLIIISGAAFFIIRWERGRLRQIKSREVKKIVPEKVDLRPKKDYLSDTRRAVLGGDSALFIKYADKALDTILEKENLDSETAGELKSMKERIYSVKFGGGTFSREEMDLMFREMEKWG